MDENWISKFNENSISLLNKLCNGEAITQITQIVIKYAVF